MSFLFTLSAASSVLNLATTTACQPIPLSAGTNGPPDSGSIGDQIVTVNVTSTANEAATTLTLVLYDPNNSKKLVAIDATITGGYRASSDGASGDYVCTVAFPDLTNKVDLNGLSKSVIAYSAGVPGLSQGSELKWYICNKSGSGTLSVYITPTRCV